MTNFKYQINTAGFTLIELLLAISITGILFGLTTISLSGAQRSTSIATSEEMLIADLKSQQAKAMNGTDYNGESFGVRFDSSNTYTLFQGTTTSPVSVDDNISFSGNEIIFSSINGEVKDYSDINPPTIMVSDTVGSGLKTIKLNRYGVVIED